MTATALKFAAPLLVLALGTAAQAAETRSFTKVTQIALANSATTSKFIAPTAPAAKAPQAIERKGVPVRVIPIYNVAKVKVCAPSAEHDCAIKR